ncbi:MAG: dephospho-CoA kinase [Caldilineales bacterium]
MNTAPNNSLRLVIGLTGNIGTGKSTVMTMLAALGAQGLDADKIAHQVMEPGQPAYRQIVRRFGAAIAPAGGAIDRARLGQIVFSDPAALADLEELVHPAVFQEIGHRLALCTVPVAIIEAIKLLEAGLSLQLCDQVWVVTAPRHQQIERLMTTRDLSEAEATLRIDAQPPQAEKIARADVVIENAGSLAQMQRQVQNAWQQHVQPHLAASTEKRLVL